MQKLIYTVGLPASGKDTLANRMVLDAEGSLKKINKDSLRMMIDSNKWSKEREKNVVKSRDTLIELWLAQGYDVICTDTNFEKRHVEAFKNIVARMNNQINVELEKIDLTNVPVFECIKRDAQRETPVGESVISNMYFRYMFDKKAWTSPIKEIAPNAILVDLDGTLAIRNGRSPFDASKYGEDLFNYNLWHLIKNQNIIFLSGREGTEEARRNTIEWLKKYTKIESDDFYMGRLFMRAEGDNRKDSIIKAEIYDNDILPHYNIIAVYDDRNQVVDMWRSKRLFCCQVNYGSF